MTSKYNREIRAEAAALLVLHGSSLTVSELVGIPASTLRCWRSNDVAFQEMCEKFWLDLGEEIRANLAQIVKEASQQTLDRVKHGDLVKDSLTGDLQRVPVKARDLAIVQGIAFDKLALAQNRPTQIISNQDSEAQLERLAEQFRALAQIR